MKIYHELNIKSIKCKISRKFQIISKIVLHYLNNLHVRFRFQNDLKFLITKYHIQRICN